MSADIAALMRWASLADAAGRAVFRGALLSRAWRDLAARRVGMDVPVALGVGAAFAASLWATLTRPARCISTRSRCSSSCCWAGATSKCWRGTSRCDPSSAGRAMPATAALLTAYPSLQTERVVASALLPGDLVLVAPGEICLPTDGVAQGESEVDESLLTGESRPVAKAGGAR
jgi:Cu2+-exporting ATPase